MSTSTENAHMVELRGVSKQFDKTKVLRDFDLSVENGEILALLGPSGCGKSTTLNIIAGFFPPDDGQVFIDGELVADVPIHRRNLGMVFQGYSLFPHKTVYDNVAFGLFLRKIDPQQIRERVRWALSLVQLPEIGDRFPAQLSGGQQQRIAVARALVVNPKVLLMDEPLSNLDARLRREMQVELKRIQSETGVTMIYVTHDQEEAITLADRIAMMRNGAIEQLDVPANVFENPSTHYVAHFMGFDNFLAGEMISGDSEVVHVKLDGGIGIKVERSPAGEPGGKVTVAIREERVVLEQILAQPDEAMDVEAQIQHSSLEDNRLIGRIEERVYAGNTFIVFLVCDGDVHIRARIPTHQFISNPPEPGMLLRIHLPKDDLRILKENVQ